MDLCKYNIVKHDYAVPNTNILCRSYEHYNAFLLGQMESNVMAPIIIHYLMRCYFFYNFWQVCWEYSESKKYIHFNYISILIATIITIF